MFLSRRMIVQIHSDKKTKDKRKQQQAQTSSVLGN